MKSVILDFSSSGEGNGGGGGGGFCAMRKQTSSQRGFVATLRPKSDSHTRDLFRLCLAFNAGRAGSPLHAAWRLQPTARTRSTSLRAGCAAHYLRYIARERFLQMFSRSGKGDSVTSAESVAKRRRSRVLVAPHRVRPEAHRTKKNVPSDQVRSFAAKRASSAQIPSAR
jgi:hypothetical protein